MTIRRMSVREAAEHFGISQDGVRQRIRRGTLESERDDDGRVYVWVDTAVQNADNVGEHRTGEQSVVEDELRERIASLERQLERRDEELQRAHQLLGESLSQLRALNAPSAQATPEAPAETEQDQTSTTEDRETSEDAPHESADEETYITPRPTLRERLRRFWRG